MQPTPKEMFGLLQSRNWNRRIEWLFLLLTLFETKNSTVFCNDFFYPRCFLARAYSTHFLGYFQTENRVRQHVVSAYICCNHYVICGYRKDVKEHNNKGISDISQGEGLAYFLPVLLNFLYGNRELFCAVVGNKKANDT